MELPKVEIAGHEISRLICGSNCFNGFSHFSAARDVWLRSYFTVERVAEVLEACQQQGINAVVGSTRPKVPKAREMVAERTGQRLIWVATTNGSTDAQEHLENMEQLAEWGAEFCLIHAGYTDSYLNSGAGEIVGIEPLLKRARELGLSPGLSTHRPETLITADKAGYDIDLYLLPLNPLGFLCPVETPWVISVIRNAKKPVLIIKPLAAGRVMPGDGLNFAFNSIRGRDIVAVGMMSPQEVEENVQITRQILEAKGEVSARGPVSPSKAAFGLDQPEQE